MEGRGTEAESWMGERGSEKGERDLGRDEQAIRGRK